ncbi:MAG: class I SAM-dependent methyltransferase [Kofleriaceae bacterium]
MAQERFLDEKKVADFWDDTRRNADPTDQTGYLADEWPRSLGHARFRGELKQVLGWLDELDAPRGRCLDVGCGVGVWLGELARRYESAHGVDLSAEMVTSARAGLAAAGLTNVTVTQQSILELPDDERYDLVFVGGVLMYVNDEDLSTMVARLGRLLTPRGVLILRESTSSPNTWYRDTPLSPGLFARKDGPRRPYTAIYRPPTAYKLLAEQHGLDIVRCEPNPHYKLSDLTETWLNTINKITFGTLARRHALAETTARAIHALRWITLVPQYHLIRTLAPGTWKIGNWWTVCRPKPSLLAPGQP